MQNESVTKKVTEIVGQNYQIITGSNFVNVKGDVNLTIDSNCKTYIKGDWDIQVDGNVVQMLSKRNTNTRCNWCGIRPKRIRLTPIQYKNVTGGVSGTGMSETQEKSSKVEMMITAGH